MRILDEGFDTALATEISDYITNMGDRLYTHSYNFHAECIENDGVYAGLFCSLAQHAGLVQEFSDVDSSLNSDTGVARIRCTSDSVTFSSQWQQAGRSVESEFLSFTNACFDAVAGKMHVRLPSRGQHTSMICVNSHHFAALDAMLRAVEAYKLAPSGQALPLAATA
jgi:hypothetical protein